MVEEGKKLIIIYSRRKLHCDILILLPCPKKLFKQHLPVQPESQIIFTQKYWILSSHNFRTF